MDVGVRGDDEGVCMQAAPDGFTPSGALSGGRDSRRFSGHSHVNKRSTSPDPPCI